MSGPSKATCAEEVTSVGAVVALAARHDVELPICEIVAAVLAGHTTPQDAVAHLMGRAPTIELRALERTVRQ